VYLVISQFILIGDGTPFAIFYNFLLKYFQQIEHYNMHHGIFHILIGLYKNAHFFTFFADKCIRQLYM